MSDISIHLSAADISMAKKYKHVIAACDVAEVSYPAEVEDALDYDDPVDGYVVMADDDLTKESHYPVWLTRRKRNGETLFIIEVGALPSDARTIIIGTD